MKRFSLFAVFFLALLVLSGCSSKYMQPADPTVAQSQPGLDEAKIVFFRATSFGGAIQSWVCEVVDGKLEHIAVVSSGAKIAHTTTPGKHIYMTGAENSELLEADMEGGRTYYVYVSPRMGWWKARFVFMPVTKEGLSGKDLRKDLAWCEWRENSLEARMWFNDNLASLNEKYREAYTDFIEKPSERKILKPEDGSPVPIF